ncbi:hypothetical protein [Qipengyuania sp. RANM35]|uniref:hypothetical protein n=1 Tax=Qipengyuania sp. RANM35 TaxID=3068635 RepID=UPI0034DB7634
MIAAWSRWGGAEEPPAQAIRASLALYDDTGVEVRSAAGFCLGAGPRDCIATSYATGSAFCGWIDNAAELAGTLQVAADDPAALYAAAVARWGSDADARVIGCYAAVLVLPDGCLRLSRSPWEAPPLYYHRDANRAVASPLLRVLFAAGAPRELDYERIIDELALDWRSGDEAAWYRGIGMVPLGAIVSLTPSGRETHRWYSPPAPAPDNEFDEDAAVAKAIVLLDEAAGKALAWAAKPALALSGGLDSPLVARALLDRLPQGETLTAITFAPDEEWQGETPPGTMGDETGLVREFVESNPALDWHIADRHPGAFDRRAKEMYAASGVFAQGLSNVGMYHDVYAKARELGCDTLLVADFGNLTFSNEGLEAYTEYVRPGRLRQLQRLLEARSGDPRSLLRKLIALSLLPRAPRWLRSVLRALVHPARRDFAALLSPLSSRGWERQRRQAAARGTEAALEDFTYDLTRWAMIEREWQDADGPARDVDLAFEQLYRIRKRDVCAYRPLAEFCLSLPLRAYAWDGTDRRLARLMGRGRVPEGIRTNILHGQHNVDWHVRMSREREAMRAAFDSARDHGWLAENLDLERLIGMLDTWPEAPDFTIEHDWPLRTALPRALMAVRFIGTVEGRNEF